MTESHPVLIVGAGPTGLTAAMELNRQGVPIRLVDKMSAFSDTSRALAVQARTLELMQQRGLAEEMTRLGNPGRAATLYSAATTLGKLDLSLIESRFNYILLLAQSETERILRKQLQRQGLTVELETEMIAFSQDPSETVRGTGSARAVLKHGDGHLEELECRFLIAAEGAHSSLRKSLVLPFKGKAMPQTYALADVHVASNLPQDELSIFLPENGLMAIFPMGNDRYRLIATDPDSTAGRPDPDLAEMQQLYNASAHIPARLHDMLWSSRFRINSRMLDELNEGLVYLGGDAAHIHSPAGGQGMNTGIQDMVNLAWKMALVYHGKAPAELLKTYGAERLPVIRSIVSTTETATDALNASNPLVHSFVTHLASAALRFQFTQHMGTGMLSEVEAQYRDSPLSENHGHLGTLRAGDRVPDLLVQTGSNGTSKAVLLHDLLDPSNFTLLVLKKEIHPDEIHAPPGTKTVHLAADTLTAENQQRFEKLFGNVGIVLVRPDAYTAFLGGPEHRDRLAKWFETWLPAPSAEHQGEAAA